MKTNEFKIGQKWHKLYIENVSKELGIRKDGRKAINTPIGKPHSYKKLNK